MLGPLRPATETLRAAVDLGRRSLQPASGILVAVMLVNFVRVSISEEFLRGNIKVTSAPMLFEALGSVFLLTLVFCVLGVGFVLLLPLQDDLARGKPASERAAMAVVVRRAIPLTVSGLVQSVITLGPPLIFCASLMAREVSAVIAEGGTIDAETMQTIQSAVLPGAITVWQWWFGVTNLLLLFATPYLLLEARGPFRSIWLSVVLVLKRALREWSAFLALAALWALLYAAVVLPESEIRRSVAALPWHSFLRTTLPAVWSAASTALALAFGSAGLVTLFRRLAPAAPAPATLAPAAP